MRNLYTTSTFLVFFCSPALLLDHFLFTRGVPSLSTTMHANPFLKVKFFKCIITTNHKHVQCLVLSDQCSTCIDKRQVCTKFSNPPL